MRTLWPAVVLAAATLGLGACGGGDKPAGYPADVRNNFLRACNLNNRSGKENACKCVLEKIMATVSYADFQRADTEIRSGGQASGETGAKIRSASRNCR